MEKLTWACMHMALLVGTLSCVETHLNRTYDRATGGYVLMVLLTCIRGQSTSSTNHKMGYFNSTLGSSATLSNVLSLRTHIAFSFRTCSFGQLVYQRGAQGDFLRIALTPNGSLEVSWKSNSVNKQGSVTVGDDTLRNNHWYTVDLNFLQGRIILKIEEGARTKYQVELSNSTFRPYLWDLNLNGSGLQVGAGYSGCIQGGPNIDLSKSGTVATNVQWGQCPDLETGCGAVTRNPCWRYPCQNGGSCVRRGDSYKCNCPLPYSGPNCETDLGHLGCQLHPCKNAGICTPKNNGTRRYTCHCASGYTGVNCEINIDECVSQPCKNGGLCRDGISSFSCNCTGTGYNGTMCTVNIDECMRSPCVNGGSCSDTPGSYKCTCPVGFGGKNCEKDVNECDSGPCRNGGKCQDFQGRYTCTCASGYTGKNCEGNVDDCSGVVCSDPRMQCVDGLNSHTCRCRPGYYDPTNSAGNASSCSETDECSSQPCQNNSTCVDLIDSFKCTCQPGFTGVHCEAEIDECSSSPCRNGATCQDHINGYTCLCNPGYTDPQCSTDINECASQPCLNGATCLDLANKFNCTCSPGWEGNRCQTETNECASNPCANGGQCKDFHNLYTCTCLAGFTGSQCQTNINDCVNNPCQNGGRCQDGVNDYSCVCTSQWMGKTCTQQYNACALGPCRNNASCSTIPPSHEYTCTCQPGFAGTNCEVNIDECRNHTCPSHTVCVDGVNTYSCKCPVGYTGAFCEIEINECASGPCKNGARCINGIGNYTCECVTKVVNLTKYTRNPNSVYQVGYKGINCETYINPCVYQPPICLNNGLCKASNDSYKCYCEQGSIFASGDHCEISKDYCDTYNPECANGGTCKASGKTYVCLCAPGFTGKKCEININECESSPCLNNATCKDLVNGYTCQCLPGFNGTLCETDINECVSSPCQHGGQCMDRVNGYVCNCTDTGFNGSHCQLNIDECASGPCQHGGNCTDGIKDYTCSCFPGFTGKNCEIDINECTSSPCKNGGLCTERSKQLGFNPASAAGYDCTCQPGFTGTHCEVDINECASNPCHKGNCVDRVNGYMCQCHPGYEGVHCELEIDECKFLPCQNGAKCLDKIADYLCLCQPEVSGIQYGGKNCSVQLIGCTVNQCMNNAKCVPYLVRETPVIAHDYTCQCLRGFHGRYCEVPTTASFNGSSFVKTKIGVAPQSIFVSFGFRTTLKEGVLFIHVNNLSWDFLMIHLTKGNKIEIHFNNTIFAFATFHTPNFKPINDADWHQVSLALTPGNLTMTLEHPDCPNGFCSQLYIPQDFKELHKGETKYGGIGNIWQEVPTLRNLTDFTGCMRDMRLDSHWIIPANSRDLSQHVELGCPRVAQCAGDPCNSHGDCTDLWNKFQCACRRPYLGATCNTSYTPATFGYGNKASLASFTVPDSQKATLATHNEVTLFFRTRKSPGTLFYLGTSTSTQSSLNTFLVIEIFDGAVRVRAKLGPSAESHDTGSNLNDGEQHYLHVSRIRTKLDVKIDDKYLGAYTIDATYDLNPEQLFVGGLPAMMSSRKRRATGGTSANQYYKGTVQDIRLNGVLLQVFPLNKRGLPPSYNTPVTQNVRQGEQSEDTCALLNPCFNNATCVNQFFNDYRCICPAGFRGKKCNLLNFCMYARCPGNATCRDLVDGYECLTPATFNGQSTMIRYSNSINETSDAATISLRFRTRKNGGILFHVKAKDPLVHYATLEITGGVLRVKYNLGQEGSVESDPNIDLLNGTWHEVLVRITPHLVSMTIDGIYTFNSSTNQAIKLATVLKDSTNIFVGGVDASYKAVSSPVFFHGCLDSIRVGSVYLPFFSKSDLKDNNSTEQFYADTITARRIGCHGDPVCASHDCKHGATCVDIWNSFKCACPAGFNGTKCENNIDECVSHQCQNGATCKDGIANYTCDCIPGYEGFRCEAEINECLSNPCQNNGTCIDKVNAYECNCTANYTGVNCEVLISARCDSQPCKNNATCVEFNTTTPGEVSFNCSCLPGYTGQICDRMIDYCEGGPCKNGGNCTSDISILNYTCSCPAGFNGYNCETNIDECASQPCKNGATCRDGINNYTCDCASGWEGTHCEHDIDECNATMINGTKPCERGVCVNTPGDYYCNCSGTGYEGKRCEQQINECLQDPCQNNATCHDLDGSYYCNCTLGYDGQDCEQGNCSHDQCLSGSTCIVDATTRQWHCQCPPFYSGRQCEIRGPCADYPCQHGAQCSQSGGDYFCNCTSGWKGKNCSEDIDECQPDNPCQNNGTCNNLPGSYNCSCLAGFTGSLCETNIDECESRPCQNGGRCVDGINRFHCDCTGTGYNGTLCELEIDECDTNPCKFGATCKNYPGNFTCLCADGYVGHTCHSIDPCRRYEPEDTCLHDGECIGLVNNTHEWATFECKCMDGWSGPRCENTEPFARRLRVEDNLPLILGLAAAGVVLLIIIAVISFMVMARNKRATRGTYSPSRQEMSGSRVEMGNVLKPPPEERLI